MFSELQRNTKTLALTLLDLQSNNIIEVIWQQVLKREQVSNPFWLVANSGIKLPKGLSLVQQNNSATQNSRPCPDSEFRTIRECKTETAKCITEKFRIQ